MRIRGLSSVSAIIVLVSALGHAEGEAMLNYFGRYRSLQKKGMRKLNITLE